MSYKFFIIFLPFWSFFSHFSWFFEIFFSDDSFLCLFFSSKLDILCPINSCFLTPLRKIWKIFFFLGKYDCDSVFLVTECRYIQHWEIAIDFFLLTWVKGLLYKETISPQVLFKKKYPRGRVDYYVFDVFRSKFYHFFIKSYGVDYKKFWFFEFMPARAITPTP